ncbi:hypothetical protein B0O80DRAFT_247058 [Mortierella sp. GBAus27b]|nr:hypothetical protein B0O80DRAFT_247058 [Mortierella sp. GBAus27b]
MLSLFRVAAKIAPPRQIHVAWPRKAFRTERLSLTCATRSRSGLPLGVRAASSDTSPPSDSSTPCESTGPSPPAKDPPSDSDSSKSGKNIVETPSNVPSQSTPMTKRRAKRASRSANKMSAPTEEPSQVYVPSIPASFLATNYHDIGSNKYRDSPMPYHVEECILDEFLNTTASCLLSQVPPQLYIQRMPARYNNILLSCLNEGSSRMLETMTHYAAAQVGADVITVDMQDLMELTADIFNSKGAGMDQSLGVFVPAQVV